MVVDQYADYAAIFLDLTKNGLVISAPFLSGCAMDHLKEDIANGIYTEEMIAASA